MQEIIVNGLLLAVTAMAVYVLFIGKVKKKGVHKKLYEN